MPVFVFSLVLVCCFRRGCAGWRWRHTKTVGTHSKGAIPAFDTSRLKAPSLAVLIEEEEEDDAMAQSVAQYSPASTKHKHQIPPTPWQLV